MREPGDKPGNAIRWPGLEEVDLCTALEPNKVEQSRVRSKTLVYHSCIYWALSVQVSRIAA
jgi:hypothetical protein